MARYVLYQAPDVAGMRKALRVPTYWPTGRRLCVVFDESTRGNISIMECGTLQSFRTKLSETAKLETIGVDQVKFPYEYLKSRVDDFKRMDRPFSRTKAAQVLNELLPQNDTNAGKPT